MKTICQAYQLSLSAPSFSVSDYNFGTLIRTDASDEYTQFNTTFGMFLFFWNFARVVVLNYVHIPPLQLHACNSTFMKSPVIDEG